jgi:hypothetical protein
MVVHEAVGVTDPVAALFDVLEGIEKIDSVLVTLEDSLLFITAGCDMVDCTGIFYSERAGHDSQRVARKEANVNSKDLTLRCSLFRNTSSFWHYIASLLTASGPLLLFDTF